MTEKMSPKKLIPWIIILASLAGFLYAPVRKTIIETYFASGEMLLTTVIGMIIVYISFIGYNAVYSSSARPEVLISAGLYFLQNILWSAGFISILFTSVVLLDQDVLLYYLGMFISIALILVLIMQILTQTGIFEEKGSENLDRMVHEAITKSYRSNVHLVICIIILSSVVIATTNLIIPAIFLTAIPTWSLINQLLLTRILKETD